VCVIDFRHLRQIGIRRDTFRNNSLVPKFMKILWLNFEFSHANRQTWSHDSVPLCQRFKKAKNSGIWKWQIDVFVMKRIIDRPNWIKRRDKWISVFRRNVHENCALLDYCAASSGNSLPTFRDNLSVPTSRVKNTKRKGFFFNSWP